MVQSPQILLPLERRRPDRLEDFVAGSNGAALAAIGDALARPGAGLILHGPAGSGKTHLLNAACNRALERGLSAFYLGLDRQPDAAAQALAGLEDFDLVCFDDLDAIAGNAGWETALFHCFNRLRGGRCRLIASSAQPLPAMDFHLPELRSRLAWGLRFRLEPLDDAGKAEVLRSRAAAAGLELPPDVVHYLLSRGPRNLGQLVQALDALRQAALAAKRRMTVPLAREVLGPD